jgi:hypothetical protein
MDKDMTVAEAANPTKAVRLDDGRLYIANEEGWIKGYSVDIRQ